MATIKQSFSARFQTTKDGDIETTAFVAGDPVTVVQTWERFLLIKDKHGHFYNVAKDKVAT